MDKALDVLSLDETFKSNGNSFLLSFCWSWAYCSYIDSKSLKSYKTNLNSKLFRLVFIFKKKINP